MPKPKKPKPKPRPGYVLLLSLLVLSGCNSCATLTPPTQLSPRGDVAFYGNKALVAVSELQSFAIDAEKAGALDREDARKIVAATVEAGQAGQVLATALKAGGSSTDARRNAAAMVEAALRKLPDTLSPHARQLTEPYIRTILLLLSAYREV
jgi:hypothetical protein